MMHHKDQSYSGDLIVTFCTPIGLTITFISRHHMSGHNQEERLRINSIRQLKSSGYDETVVRFASKELFLEKIAVFSIV